MSDFPQDGFEQVAAWLKALQDRICRNLENLDGQAVFLKDDWQHEFGGGGQSRVLENGAVFEKAGVNFSHVHGSQLPDSALSHRGQLRLTSFQAVGVSLVVHPRNPYVPTSHANVRLFSGYDDDHKPFWWFGGGFDLTPFYPFDEDILHWHQVAQRCCVPFGADVYPRYKSWCDRYFYLPHRDETRGVGGLFFDDLHEWGFGKSFEFMRRVGDAYMQGYAPIVERRSTIPYAERERLFQLYRRGRYVEFNLLYDRGTRFGLESGGRTESILMSMPPLAAWKYDWHTAPDSREAKLNEYLKPRSWLGEESPKV